MRAGPLFRFFGGYRELLLKAVQTFIKCFFLISRICTPLNKSPSRQAHSTNLLAVDISSYKHYAFQVVLSCGLLIEFVSNPMSNPQDKLYMYCNGDSKLKQFDIQKINLINMSIIGHFANFSCPSIRGAKYQTFNL